MRGGWEGEGRNFFVFCVDEFCCDPEGNCVELEKGKKNKHIER